MLVKRRWNKLYFSSVSSHQIRGIFWMIDTYSTCAVSANDVLGSVWDVLFTMKWHSFCKVLKRALEVADFHIKVRWFLQKLLIWFWKNVIRLCENGRNFGFFSPSLNRVWLYWRSLLLIINTYPLIDKRSIANVCCICQLLSDDKCHVWKRDRIYGTLAYRS